MQAREMDRKGEGKPGVDRPGQLGSHENGYAKGCIYTSSVLAFGLWFIFFFSSFDSIDAEQSVEMLPRQSMALLQAQRLLKSALKVCSVFSLKSLTPCCLAAWLAPSTDITILDLSMQAAILSPPQPVHLIGMKL
jgi:hypothetical protein